VEGETDRSATVEVRSVSGSRIAIWGESAVSRVLVMINGKRAGMLSDRQPQSFMVAPGVVRVTAKSGFLRSRTLVLSLAAGEIATLDCGFRTGPHVLLGMLVMSVFGVVNIATTASGTALPSIVYLSAMAVVGALLIDLLRGAFTPGARLNLRPHAVLDTADIMPTPAVAPKYLIRTEPLGGRFQVGLRGLLIFVACCAPILWIAREIWDRRPENALARAIRMLRSDDPGERPTGARDLQLLFMLNALRPKEVDAVIPHLLTALRDQQTAVRKPVMYSLFHIVSDCGQRSLPVPRAQPVATGLAEALRDTEFEVRRLSALSLANLYFTYSRSGAAASPLPGALDRFLELLSEAVEDPSSEVRSWAFQVLQTIAPRVGRAAPSRLVAALNSKYAVTRREAAYALAHFPVGVDTLLPKLFEYLEQEKDPKARRYCSGALMAVRPSRAAIPHLLRALRSSEESVRFRAAELLGRIGANANDAVPAVLALLVEPYEPSTDFDREHPESTDPAVAATWALRSIAPGTEMAEQARTSLLNFSLMSDQLWRRAAAQAALRYFEPSPDLAPPPHPEAETTTSQ
jgi:HEAT repeat protein